MTPLYGCFPVLLVLECFRRRVIPPNPPRQPRPSPNRWPEYFSTSLRSVLYMYTFLSRRLLNVRYEQARLTTAFFCAHRPRRMGKQVSTQEAAKKELHTYHRNDIWRQEEWERN